LLDTAPAGIDAERVGATLVAVDGVQEAHDIHVWTIGPGDIGASAHVRIAASCDGAAALDAMQAALRGELGIDHATLQVRVDRGSLPVDTVRLMDLGDAVEWATDHVARAHPDLARGVIAAAAGAAAIGLNATGRVSPVTLSRRTLDMLGRRVDGADA